jgi:hypothetical protein
MMISSEATQFDLDFPVVEVDHRHLQTAKLVSEQEPVPPGEFGRLAQGEPPHLEEADRKLERQFSLDLTSRFPARQEQVIRILQRQVSHAVTVAQAGPRSQAHGFAQPAALMPGAEGVDTSIAATASVPDMAAARAIAQRVLREVGGKP